MREKNPLQTMSFIKYTVMLGLLVANVDEFNSEQVVTFTIVEIEG